MEGKNKREREIEVQRERIINSYHIPNKTKHKLFYNTENRTKNSRLWSPVYLSWPSPPLPC